MKTSARNQFTGVVRAVNSGAVNDEIELEVSGGLRIVATVTSDSRKRLGLEVGTSAFALVKASSLILMIECKDVRVSARNQLTGKVSQITQGAVNSEVTLALAGGDQVTAIITNESTKNLGIAPGSSATAIFKASDVILGVRA